MKKSIITLAVSATMLSSTANAEWISDTHSDQMTGEVTAYAHSILTDSDKPNGLAALLTYACEADKERAFIMFPGSQLLHIADTNFLDDPSLFRTRTKWDEDIITTKFAHKWGSDTIHFSHYNKFIKLMESANTMLLQLKLHSGGSSYFKFSLDGAAKGIAKARSACNL